MVMYFSMDPMFGVITILMVAMLTPAVQGYKTSVTGAGTLYKLNVTQDVWLELPNKNFNNYRPFLLVSKHPGYPNKRSLVQFEDLPRASCPSSKIKFAKMYLYFVYAHKASFHSVKKTPYIPRHLQVHLVRKHWHESQATSTKRLKKTKWSSRYLSLDGKDAEVSPQCGTVTIFTSRPGGFVEFDITDAMKSWANGVHNNGLLIRATNELDAGRDIRFASKSMRDSRKHAFVNVLCA